jgi:biotin carboxyl carrier protein
MKYIATLYGKQRTVEIEKVDDLYRVTVDGKSFLVDAFHPGGQSVSMLIDGETYEAGIAKKQNAFSVYFYNDTIELELIDARKFQSAGAARSSSAAGPVKIYAPMPGKVVKVKIEEQSTVNEGDPLMVIEAMKMQNELKAPKSGTVSKINVKDGEAVSISQVLMVLD